MTRSNLMKLVWLRARLAREAAATILKDKAPTGWGFYTKLVWGEFRLNKASLLAAPTHAAWHRNVIRGHYECIFLLRRERAGTPAAMARVLAATEQHITITTPALPKAA